MPVNSLACLIALVASASTAISAEIEVTFDNENVVSSRLEGAWQVHTDITKRLGGDAGGAIEFKRDHSIVNQIPEKYAKFLADRPLYMAGIMKLKKNDYPFILVEVKGNPHIVYFRERAGEPLGDAESFNVMLAVAKEKPNDLLFVGGDFNNQPFSAYERFPRPVKRSVNEAPSSLEN